ncbi:aminotransferase class IV [Actinomycetospora straminea]|uniref:Branched-chain amino acid transaminase n=1 Tax=Actinomycetospora straminea TaxID=663607 RepID=A0ABP9E0L3_9PSEU|nr:aminotransferase class IV [Actinomycetospora straminea]MDD7931108.1 aminotransferase class IV [Actinomycetospora straminea]
MAHVASLSQLQTPRWASVDGALAPYADVKVHISAEALTRALSIFEGVKGYWDADSSTFMLRSPLAHLQRLRRSARLFHIPFQIDDEEWVRRHRQLAAELLVPGRDLWLRPTLYVTEGHWGEGTVATMVITAFTQTQAEGDPMRLGVSTWRRGTDVDLPTRVKSSANYVVARLARIEARRLGYDDAILLNREGRVAEATGACVVLVTDEGIVVPPSSEGALDSLTVRIIEQLCLREAVDFTRRPVDRTELLAAREVGIAGTISELTLVDEVDGFRFPVDGLLRRLRDAYLRVMRGQDHLPGVDMVPVLTAADVAARDSPVTANGTAPH